MKILFTGGATGGHFYPIIAVAEAIREEAKEKKIIAPHFYFMSPSKYNPRALFDNEIEFVRVPAGKIRRYFSLLNVTDWFKTAYGVMAAFFSMFDIYPDVVFGKGGYGSFPALVAARILHIPVIIHESDSAPGRVNAWAAKFAKKIAVSYPDAAEVFKKNAGKNADAMAQKIAYTGNPIRRDVLIPLSNGARDYLKLEEKTPVIFILGGSQGSEFINNVMIDAIPELINKYEIIHQTGRKNFDEVSRTLAYILKDNPNALRYKPFNYLDTLALRMSAGVANIIISRAGSSIFEIAAWGIPSIIIPLNQSVSHDQTENAFSYARAGACSVIEEHNLTPHVLIAEIERIVNTPALAQKMKTTAKNFARIDSAKEIAQVILEIALKHE
jgi:UDP-N-acetylglucosamine--N-acetylmuramyl-(pentapeptide) pyrophosphoryl-undecaprenol N-acetylglucosamine transferase